jgi:hypothetical protein
MATIWSSNYITNDTNENGGNEYKEARAVRQLRWLVADLSPRRPGLAPRPVYVGFVVGKVALGRGFLRVLRFAPDNIIPPLIHIYSYINWGMDNGSVCGPVPQRPVSPHRGKRGGTFFLTLHTIKCSTQVCECRVQALHTEHQCYTMLSNKCHTQSLKNALVRDE